MRQKMTGREDIIQAKTVRMIIFAIIAVLAVMAVMKVAYGTSIASMTRIIIGLGYILFLPGYLFSILFFPNNEEIDDIERIGLSFGISIALTMAALLIADRAFMIPLTAESITTIMGELMAVMVVMIVARKFITRKPKQSS
ncbi:DUF1616 domain-containing protein [Candidatus Altiarchaeota archaeon]